MARFRDWGMAACLMLAGLVMLASGCGAPWAVLRQATPDPFLGQPAFVMEPMHFEGMTVGQKTEAGYLADKKPEQVQRWEADKGAMVQGFTDILAAEGVQIVPGPPNPQSPQTFVIRPIVTFLEPGFFVGVWGGNTEVHLTVQFLGPQGQVLDEIAVRATEGASLYNPAIGGRLRSAAKRLGILTARYIKGRQRGAR